MIPLVTLFVGAVVAGIAFLQWRTAREKVLLDLFDKRFALYEELRSIVGRWLGSGIDQPAFFDFTRAASRSQFLFGPEVQTYLEGRRIDLSREMTSRNIVEPRPPPEDRREAVYTELVARKDRLSNFFTDFDLLVAPYMNHHQKALGSVFDVGRLPRLQRLLSRIGRPLALRR
jgi:Tfp pilus assembly protein PilN